MVWKNKTAAYYNIRNINWYHFLQVYFRPFLTLTRCHRRERSEWALSSVLLIQLLVSPQDTSFLLENHLTVIHSQWIQLHRCWPTLLDKKMASEMKDLLSCQVFRRFLRPSKSLNDFNMKCWKMRKINDGCVNIDDIYGLASSIPKIDVSAQATTEWAEIPSKA